MNHLKWTGRGFESTHNRIAFVSFSNGRYLGQEVQLRKTVEAIQPNSDVFTFHSFEEIRSPTHKQNPYAFKVYAIQTVRDMGYKTIIWCDSVCRLKKEITDILPTLKNNGVYLQADGWPVGTWANDRALNYFGVTRDDAMKIEAIYACIMMFDFTHPIANEFFRRWKKAAEDGIFYGQWVNDGKTESQDERCRGHRHDQTCAELISHQLGIQRSPSLFAKENKYFSTYNFP